MNSSQTDVNPLLNGWMDHFPDSTSVSAAAGIVGVTHAIRALGQAGVGSLSRQTFTAGQTDVPLEPTNFLRWAMTTAPTAPRITMSAAGNDGDTITVNDGTTQRVYELDNNSSVTAGNVAVTIGGSAAATAANLAAAITTQQGGSTARLTVSYTSGNAFVELTNKASFTPALLRLSESTSGARVTVANPAAIITSIEDVRTYATNMNRRVCLQGFIRSNVVAYVNLAQAFGSGGSPSAEVFVDPVADARFLLSTVDPLDSVAKWRPFQIAFSVPSLNGKTIGSTANTSRLGVQFTWPLGVTGQIDLVGLELVPIGTRRPGAFRRSTASEEELLARYYSVQNVVGAGAIQYVPTQRRMRVAPTLTASAGTAANATVDGFTFNHTVNVAATVTVDSRM